MSTDINHLKVGSFGATYGIKGSIKVHPTGDALFNCQTPLPCEVETTGGIRKNILIKSFTPNGNSILAKIEGYDSPESVALFRSAVIFLVNHKLPELEGEEIYVTNLVGLSAVTALGEESLGYKIAEVIDNPAHPILRFVSDSEETETNEILVPFLNLYIGDWDLKTKQIVVISWQVWFEV